MNDVRTLLITVQLQLSLYKVKGCRQVYIDAVMVKELWVVQRTLGLFNLSDIGVRSSLVRVTCDTP